MLDIYTGKIARRALHIIITPLVRLQIAPTTITVLGFFFGIAAALCIIYGNFIWGLLLVVVNRLCDGIDGELSRTIHKKTHLGGYLDITFDFFFYSLIPMAFAIQNPTAHALPATLLMYSFVLTGVSFLSASLVSEKLRFHEHKEQVPKYLFYLRSLAEGTETVIFFTFFLIFPQHFALLAYIFALLCTISGVTNTIVTVLHIIRTEKALSTSTKSHDKTT